jgi:UDPglucose 6-dehydrogenase
VGIAGLGMVGTPLKKWFEEKGYKRGKDLFCFDADNSKGYLDDISFADVVFVCVPTSSKEDGSCDIGVVESVVSQFQNSDKVIVIKSTVTPGTTKYLSQKYGLHVLFCPEFLTESRAWEDFIRPDRQIMGHGSPKARRHLNAVLRILPQGSFQSPGVFGTYDFYEVDSTEAEMAKYAGNVFGAVKVAFSNILADFASAIGADYEKVKMLVSHDRRIGGAWMDVFQGNYRGFGGYCFPKDFRAFISFAENLIENFPENDNKNTEVMKKAVSVLKSVWDYNEALLNSQGLTIKDVSAHGAAVKCKTGILKNKNKGA